MNIKHSWKLRTRHTSRSFKASEGLGNDSFANVFLNESLRRTDRYRPLGRNRSSVSFNTPDGFAITLVVPIIILALAKNLKGGGLYLSRERVIGQENWRWADTRVKWDDLWELIDIASCFVKSSTSAHGENCDAACGRLSTVTGTAKEGISQRTDQERWEEEDLWRSWRDPRLRCEKLFPRQV